MSPILLFSICLACSKYLVAEDLQYGQTAAEPLQMKYSPSLRVPLSYSSPSLDYPSSKFGQSFQEPLTHHIVNPQFDRPQPSSDICPQQEILQTILVLLKRLLNQNNLYAQPEKGIHILQALKEYLESTEANVDKKDNQQILQEILNTANNPAVVENVNDENDSNNIKAKVVFKYEIPNINNVGCKEALTSLIQTVKNAHMQMINYCNQSGKCSIHTNSGVSFGQDSNTDLNNILKPIPDLHNPVHIQKQIQSSNQNSLNIHNLKSTNNLLMSQSQLFNQLGSNDYLNTHIYPDSYMDGNKFLFTGSVNSAIDKTVNNQEKNKLISHHMYLNNQEQKSNILHSDKSNVLKSVLSSQIPAQVQITPSNRYPLNIYGDQSPLNIPQNQRQSNDFLHSHAHLQPDFNVGQFVTTDHFNRGVLKSQFFNNHKENLVNLNNNYLMGHRNNGNMIDDSRNFNVPTNRFSDFERNNYRLPILQNFNVKRDFLETYNNKLNKQSSYNKLLQLSGGFEDKSSSLSTLNQNIQNINKHAQYDRTMRTPNDNFNYLYFENPNELKKIEPENVLQSNMEHRFGKLHNNIERQHINRNFGNNLYYNTQQADAIVSSNFGFNPYASTVSVEYPKSNIYGNNVNSLDFYRFPSVPQSVKLTSPDTNGMVELTYKLKRPESLLHNTYYYAKFRMPYKNFIAKMRDWSNNPDMRSNPMKAHEELLAISNLVETSADLQNIQRDEVSKLVIKNGGDLINAEVIGSNDSNADKYLKTIQNLNANLNTNDVLNLFDNYKNYKTYSSLDSDVPIYRPDPYPYEKEYQFQNGDSQYFDDEARRLFVPIVQYDPKMVRFPFQPVDFSKTYPIPVNHYNNKPNGGVYY